VTFALVSVSILTTEGECFLANETKSGNESLAAGKLAEQSTARKNNEKKEKRFMAHVSRQSATTLLEKFNSGRQPVKRLADNNPAHFELDANRADTDGIRLAGTRDRSLPEGCPNDKSHIRAAETPT
jgi:hypothetical protein